MHVKQTPPIIEGERQRGGGVLDACLSLSRLDRVVSLGTGSRVSEQVKMEVFAI